MNWKLIRKIDTYVGIPLMYAGQCLRKAWRGPRRVPAGEPARRILLVKFWGIGNIFMMLPAVQTLKAGYPDAEIDLLTLETNRIAAAAIKTFRAVHAIDTRNVFRFIRTSLSTMRALRRREYDIVVDFEQFARFSAIVCAVIGKKISIGFNTAGQHRHFFYSRPVRYENGIHMVRSYRSLSISAFQEGIGHEPVSPVVRTDPDGRDLMRRLGIRMDRPTVLMHIGTSSNFKERRWPIRHYAALADLLIDNHNAQVVLSGLKEETPCASEMADFARSDGMIIDMIGKLDFDDFFSLIRLCDLVVSADTAPVHLASACGTPVVGLYGPNTPLLYGPWGGNGLACYENLACSPCITNFNAKLHVCRHPEGKGACMDKIRPEDVYRKIRERFFSPQPASHSKGTETLAHGRPGQIH
ncbi:MAG: glycosyltransferase family 9 protein [Thermodesulfovibrionales bacterium]